MSNPPAATTLVELAHKLFDFALTESGEPFATRRDGPAIVVPFKGHGRSLRNQLTSEFYKRKGKPPNNVALDGALRVLSADAVESDRVEVHLRTAPHPSGGLVIDLGDPEGRAVSIREGSWELVKCPPEGIVFRRTQLTRAMPEPERGGDLEALRERDLINVTDESWDLMRAWLICSLFPQMPVPILAATGHQGAGKSVLGRFLVSLVDPSPAPLRSTPSDLHEWTVTANGSRVVGIDNVSRISTWLSDALCRAVTGEGFAKRMLYENDELVVMQFRRAILLTSIDPGSMRGDLGERLLPVELSPIGTRQRRTETELQGVFDRSHASLLGGLLDLAAKVIANPVELDALPRMADAAKVIAAVDAAVGSHALAAYNVAQGGVVELVLDSDPVATALLNLMEKRKEWNGSPTELYALLKGLTDPNDRKQWPGNARGLSERIARLAPALDEARGLVVEKRRGTTRRIELRWRKGKPK